MTPNPFTELLSLRDDIAATLPQVRAVEDKETRDLLLHRLCQLYVEVRHRLGRFH